MEIVLRGFVVILEIQFILTEKIREVQKSDKEIVEIKQKMEDGKVKGFREDEYGILWFEDRIYVFNDFEFRKLIFQEVYDFSYSIYFGNIKMYLDLKESFWWTGLKKDIAEFVVICDVCQRVKAEYQKSAGLF